MSKNSGKGKRKQTRYSGEQLSQYNRALAKEANKYLGTKFNLRKKGLSKYAVSRLKEFERYGLLSGRELIKGVRPEPAFVAVPASRKQVQMAKKEGWEYINGRLIVPNNPEAVKRVKRNLKEGKFTGVQRLPEAAMEVVHLPFGLKDIRDLIERLEDGTLNSLKHKDEFFAFKFYGYPSHRPFRTAQDLAAYLTNYKSILDAAQNLRVKDMQDMLEHFELVRFYEAEWPPRDIFIPRRRSRNRSSEYDRRKRVRETIAKAKAKKENRDAATAAERMRKSRANMNDEQRAAQKEKDKLRKRRERDAKLRKKLEDF